MHSLLQPERGLQRQKHGGSWQSISLLLSLNGLQTKPRYVSRCVMYVSCSKYGWLGWLYGVVSCLCPYDTTSLEISTHRFSLPPCSSKSYSVSTDWTTQARDRIELETSRKPLIISYTQDMSFTRLLAEGAESRNHPSLCHIPPPLRGTNLLPRLAIGRNNQV